MTRDSLDRDLAAMLEARADRSKSFEIDVAAIVRANQLGARQPIWESRLAGAAAALAVCLVLAAGALLVGSSRTSPMASGVPATSLSPTPTSEPSPSGETGRTTSGIRTVADLLVTPLPIGTFEVRGWLVAASGGALRCAFQPPPPSGEPVYGCGEFDWLTDAPYRPDPGYTAPADGGLRVQYGAYAAFAGDPSWPSDTVFSEPRYGVWLVRTGRHDVCTVEPGCPPGGVRIAEILGRGDADGTAPLGGPIRTVDEATGLHPETGTEVVVRGWLVGTPPLRCLGAPPPSGPDFSCGEYDVLTSTSVQIWMSDGTDGSLVLPKAFLRVQNGAYLAFAPDPQVGEFGVEEPRLGTFRIRLHVGSTCDAASPEPGVGCAGGPTFQWEIVERLDGAQLTAPSPSVPPSAQPTPGEGVTRFPTGSCPPRFLCM